MIKALESVIVDTSGYEGNNRVLTQLLRNDKAALYTRTVQKTGAPDGFEIFAIEIRDDKEHYPQLGETGLWYTKDDTKAMAIFEALTSRQPEEAKAPEAPVDPNAPKKHRGRPKAERPVITIPDVEFSTREVADSNHIEYVVASSFVKEQEAAGLVKRTRTERRSPKGPETQLFVKIV